MPVACLYHEKVDSQQNLNQNLNRGLIVDEALSITRADGLRKVTMRAVGSRLGVTPMALYRHIAGREELNRLIVDSIGARFALRCAPDAPWDERVRSWARSQRTLLRQYPGVAAWLIDNGPAGSNAYRTLDLLAAALLDGGFSESQTARGTALVMSWTFSRIAIEDEADLRAAADLPERSQEFINGLSAISAERYPAASRIGAEFFALPMEEIFNQGIASIIQGLQRS